MKRVPLLVMLVALLNFACTSGETENKQAGEKPNVIIILADDLGWGDVGFNGCTDIPTPNLDELAVEGVVFTAGYASHSYCGPSRAGLLTGRYQQRFGCENNLNRQVEGALGLPLSEPVISEVLKENGYTTCAIGKWHLGDSSQFWPTNRGFDNWFGFTGGSRDYWGHRWPNNYTSWHRIYRDGKPEPLENLGYLTDDFTNAALDYIDDYSKEDSPFFMYLAYNAPHAPIQATREYLDATEHIEDGKRAAYGAMVAGMDIGIGKVIEKLKETGEYENTLIFFYSDNGGHGNGTSQDPYRGRKGMLFEGGIRVPFTMSWPAVLGDKITYSHPITALDIFTTVLSAADINYDKKDRLEGVNLLPFVKGESTEAPHDKLFWRYSEGMGYAVRIGDYKLVKEAVRGDIFLFNMKEDPLEHKNLAEQMPEKVKELQAEYDIWDKENIANLWVDAHPENVLKTKAEREQIINRTCGGEKKN